MKGKLYVIGVGPGDPELLTLKAARILDEVGTIFVPKGREAGESLALSIASRAVNLQGKEIVETYFPMKKTAGAGRAKELDSRWNGTVEVVLDRLGRGIDAAFITIGDPTIYSTFFYLYEGLLAGNPSLKIEIIPGISSINAAASRAGVSLGLADERIAIIPANYAKDLGPLLAKFETVVLMKVYKVFAGIVEDLRRQGLLERAVYVSRAGMPDEMICRDLAALRPEDLDYFSLVIVRRQQPV